MLARPLTTLSDPMSGFFGVTKGALAAGKGKISAVGFKIGLEVYVKTGIKKHAEVQIFFAKREAGESKLTGKVRRPPRSLPTAQRRLDSCLRCGPPGRRRGGRGEG